MMALARDLILDDYFKLRISSKKLNSGRYQVKFYATVQQEKDLYGYVLVNADETLKTVINKIRVRLQTIDYTSEHHHFHLYSIGHDFHDELNFMIFQ
jgi:hypothetical protein